MRELDVEPDRGDAGHARAAVGGLHDPRAAAGDDREARLAEHPGGLARALVLGVAGARAGGAEDRDGLADVRERGEPGAQLLVDPPDPVGVVEVGLDVDGLRLEQLLVERLGAAAVGIDMRVHSARVGPRSLTGSRVGPLSAAGRSRCHANAPSNSNAPSATNEATRYSESSDERS